MQHDAAPAEAAPYWELQSSLRERDLATVEHWLRDPNISQNPTMKERLTAYVTVLRQDAAS
eukprot:2039355-Prymnesium_polylepis.1